MSVCMCGECTGFTVVKPVVDLSRYSWLKCVCGESYIDEPLVVSVNLPQIGEIAGSP